MSDFPYPGLRPFQRDETDIFFGREDHTDELIEKLGNTHFIAVVGPSGCGKSSLVRTGLLAGLETGFLASAGVRWRIAELRPGTQPFHRLAEALLVDKALGPEYLANFTPDADAAAFLYANLRRGSLSLHEIYKETLKAEQTNLLLVVDQFEELFRYYRQDSAYQAAAFVALLLASSRHQAIYVVITMRSDFIGDCALFYDLPEAINQGLFLTPRLTRDQLRDAIEGPANVFDGDIEATLVNQLLNDIGNDPDQLPLLQHALMRMWNLATAENPQQILLTSKHYDSIGGLTTALSKHAEEAYTELEPTQRKIADILFCNLTERGNGQRDTRRPVKLEEVATQANVPWQEVAQVVEVFRQADRSFLTPSVGQQLEPDSVIDISHESLIRRWQRLKEWTQQEADSAEQYRRLEDTARLWNKQRADLLSGVEFEIASAWYQRTQPSAAWAKRYGYDEGRYFDLALRFLDKSKEQQKREREKKEAVRQSELRRVSRKVAWAVTGLIAMTALAAWGLVETLLVLEQKQIAEQAKLESQLNNAAWLARFEDYAKAKNVLSNINKSVQATPEWHFHALRLLNWFSKQTNKSVQDSQKSHFHARRLLNWFTGLMGSDFEKKKKYKSAKEILLAVAVSPDGKQVAAAGLNKTLMLFDAEDTKKYQFLQGHTGTVRTIDFHPQGQWLVSGGDDKRIIFWSLPEGKKLRELEGSPDEVKALAFSPDGKYLASAGGEDESKETDIILWDTQTGKKRGTFKGHTARISDGGLAFNPSGEWLASASHDKTVRLWNVNTHAETSILEGFINTANKAIFSPDGRYLATCSKQTVYLWKIAPDNKVELAHKLLHQGEVYALSFVAEGRYLVSAGEDQSLRLWDFESEVTLRVFQGNSGDINDIAVTKAGKIYSASNDKTVKRWNIGLPDQWLVELPGTPISVAIAPNSKRVVVGFKDGTLRLYSLPKRQWLGEKFELQLLGEKLKAHKSWVKHLALNSEGTLLASGSSDKTAKLWKLTTDNKFQEKQQFRVHTDKVSAVAFSPKHSLLATASYDGNIGLFRVGTEQEKNLHENAHQGRVYSVSFDNSGTRLLSGGKDGMRLWKVDLNKLFLSPLDLHSQKGVKWISFSPDGKRVANVGRDSLVHIYKTDPLKEEQDFSLRGHRNTITRAIFSPDSRQVVTASADSTVRMWDLSNPLEHHLFTLSLPTNRPIVDFDFRCNSQGYCWIVVPLREGKLALYDLERIYD
jgi:WD40 repeat protein/energy-coupling factor transporter ATP-binding protein EcfA2